MRPYFAINQNRRQGFFFFLPFLPKAINRKDKGCYGANIETMRYLDLSMRADKCALPILAEEFASEIDHYAWGASSNNITARLRKIVDTLNRMLEEAEAHKSEECRNGGKVEPGPRVRLVISGSHQ